MALLSTRFDRGVVLQAKSVACAWYLTSWLVGIKDRTTMLRDSPKLRSLPTPLESHSIRLIQEGPWGVKLQNISQKSVGFG